MKKKVDEVYHLVNFLVCCVLGYVVYCVYSDYFTNY